jgi:Uncharacterised nucleotidyltransferase
MKSAYFEVPPPKVLQAALRRATETLARELAQPSDSAPEWSDFEWRIARAVAAIHGVSPLLSHALRWQGPADWQEFLQQQKAHTATRHSRIQELLRLIDKRAGVEGICVVALKGAELHATGLYTPGERPMADLDLLVRPEDQKRTARMLESLGFDAVFSNWRHGVFAPREPAIPRGLGEHADNYLKIELHDGIREVLPVDTADISEWMFPTQPRPGLNPYPSRAALMSHLLLHAAGSMANRALRLLQLHDLALLCRCMTERDWDEVLRQSATGRGHWWALPPLHLTARYYSCAIPTGVIAGLSNVCPRLLRATTLRRTLSDVSLSRLRIEAFPGIEWSTSVSEMARYVVSRVRPSREMLALRKEVATTRTATPASQWDHLSQSRRVLKWVLSRPARPYTMHAVHMVLGQAHQ